MILRNGLLYCFFLCFASMVIAQEYSFLNYSIENGLPQSQVSAITQCKDGYLWVGTMGGLARFNGQSFYTFTKKDHLLSNRITSLNISNDSLLIGHEGGFSIGIRQQFTSYKLKDIDKNVVVSKILSFRGKLFIFTNGSGIYTFEKGKLTALSLASNDENRIRGAISHKETLYLGTRAGILVSQNGAQFQAISSTAELNISSLILYDKNRFFFATFDGEIGFYNLQDNSLQFIPIQGDFYGLRNIFKDSKNQLWIPHLDGVIFLSKELKPTYFNLQKGLPYENINTIYEDINQTIWMGSEGKGIYKFTGNHLQKYTLENVVKNNLILATTIAQNRLYFGTYAGKIIVQNIRNSNVSVIDINNGPVWSITKESDHSLLIGTGGGLYQLNTANQQFKKLSLLPADVVSQKVTAIRTKNGITYIAGDFGIAAIQQQKLLYLLDSRVYNTSTVRALEFFDETLYAGSDNGLFFLKNKELHLAHQFDKKIFALKTDNKRRIWIGTDDGIYYLKDSIHAVSISPSPSANIINFINTDSQHLIVGTNNGVFYTELDDSELNFKRVGIEEGLSNLESNINSSFVDKQGTIYFGTVNGVNQLNLFQLKSNSIVRSPHINIQNISINFAPIDTTQYVIRYSPNNEIQQIILPHNKNNILLDIDGVTLKKYASFQYQYKIEGLDDTWSAKFKNPQINITNLPPGNYTISIRGIIEGQVYSNTVSFQVIIKAPFYQQAWFIILIAIFITFGIYWIFRRRIIQEQQKNAQEKLEIKNRLGQLEQQSLNASMNRHFIFNSLNSIQYFINTQDKASANKYLTSFAKLIRKNLDSSSEGNNLVPLDEELERLSLYLELESIRFQGRFEYEIRDEDVFTDDYLVPAMLLQPFVENSILHGILPSDIHGKIIIEINNYPNHIEIRIRDNGIGINQSLKNKGIESLSHKSKGMEISSKRIDLLRKLYNQNFELIGPYQTMDEDGLISGTTVLIKIPKENL